MGYDYTGQSTDGVKPHGYGVLRQKPDRSCGWYEMLTSAFRPMYRYEGFWADGEKHGPGRETTSDGTQILGEWRHDIPVGVQSLVNAQGGYQSGIVTGGSITMGGASIDGGFYMGELHNGEPNGNGMMHYANGSIYTGSFENGKKHGDNGRMKYIERFLYFFTTTVGEYVGSWRDGKRHGKGVLYYDGKNCVTCTWENDVLTGWEPTTEDSRDVFQRMLDRGYIDRLVG